MMKILLQKYYQFDKGLDAGLLAMRVLVSAMMLFGHGWGKLAGFSERAATFSDPLGVGSQMSLTLAVFGEFFCPILVALGLLTRLSAIPVVITMLVAGLIVHADDPWRKMEFALLFAVPFATLVFTGPGRYSLDHALKQKINA